MQDVQVYSKSGDSRIYFTKQENIIGTVNTNIDYQRKFLLYTIRNAMDKVSNLQKHGEI